MEVVLPEDRVEDQVLKKVKDHPPMAVDHDSHSHSKSLDRRLRTRATVKMRHR